MRSARALAVLVLSAGCQSSVALEATLPQEARSVVVLSLGADGPVIEAIDLDTTPSLSIWGAEVWVLPFRCKLERLGLMPGRQALSLSPAERPILPDGLAPLKTSDAFAGAPVWREEALSAAAEEALRRLPVSQHNRCLASRARFDPVRVRLPGALGAPQFATAMDPEHVLVGTRNGRAFLVDKDAGFEEIDFGGRVIMAVYRAADGELWMIERVFGDCAQATADHYNLLRGPLRGEPTVVTSAVPVPNCMDYVAMAGPTPGHPFELFVAAGDGGRRGLARYDGAAWTKLAEAGFSGIFLPAVAWLGPKEALAIGVDKISNANVLRYTNGATLAEALPGGLEGAASLAYFPKVGAIVGRDNGELDIRQGRSWVSLSIGQASYYTRSLAPVSDGFIYHTGLEVNFLQYEFGQYFPGIGGCPLEKLTDYAASHLAALADGSIVATTLSTFNAPLELYVLKLSAAAKDCGPPPKD